MEINKVQKMKLNNLVRIFMSRSEFFLSSPEDILFIAFRERGKEIEREREKHRCAREAPIAYPDQGSYTSGPGVTFACTWPQAQTHNLYVCPDQKLNLKPFSDRVILQQTEPHWPGQERIFIENF